TASTGFGVRAASKISTSALNLATADCVCASVSACPTTRMSSSSAKTLRNPARKMACVSATITRTNWPLPPSVSAPRFSSTLTGMVAIQSLCLCPFEMVFVNHYTNAAPTSIFKTANHPAATINLYIATGTQAFGRQQNCEIHHRSDWNVFVHRKKYAIRRDVFRLRGIVAALSLDRRREMQGKAWRALHVFVVSCPRLRLGHWCCSFGCHAEKNLSFRKHRCCFPDFIQLKGSVHPHMCQTKLPKSWNKWGLTAFL